jgi:LytS/YehU family sensor histidine kinase
MEIEKIRFGDRLVVDYQIESPSDQAQVPSLILQPLFENAIKHGMYDSLDRVEINVSSHLEEEVLILTVSNSFEKEGSIKKGERIGLKNVEERLRLLYENRSSIAVNTDSTIFKVTLAIPQNK